VDKHEAKAILACYRPGRDDPRDPEFAEALERARQDPQLARWLQGQMERDAALHRQFTEIPVPPFLRDRILAFGAVPSVSCGTNRVL
jgi:hypothetical protein